MSSEAISKWDRNWHHMPDTFAGRFWVVAYADTCLYYRQPHHRGWDRYDYPKCELHRCDICGRLQAKRRCIQAVLPLPQRGRNYIDEDFGWRWVCIGCNSKIRAVWRLYAEFKEIRRLINHLDKEITRARHNDYGVSTPSLAAIDRGRSRRSDGPSCGDGRVEAGGTGERLASG